MRILIKHETWKLLFLGTLVRSTLLRGPEELFYAQGIIPGFLSLPQGLTWEEHMAKVKKYHVDKLLAKYLDMFVEEINIPENEK